jgi:phage terminase large subunit
MTFDFLKPDYDSIFKQRAKRLKALRKNPSMLSGLREYYKTHPADFITDWGCTFDPRNAELGLPTVVPFILFDKQREFIDWLYSRWRGRGDGLVEKSRDMGVSWLCVAFGAWMWCFHSGTVIGYGSRKEEYVDKLGDPKSLFWKAREFIKFLPKEFKPKSYDDPFMRIINNDNGAVLIGESGDNIGRGNRTSIYFKDESAFYERPEAIDAALSQTSNCKIDVSTPNGNGNPFYRKRHGGKIPVFTFRWTDDPRKDKAWYQKQCDTLDPVIVAQEINIDYESSVSNALISGDYISEAQRTRPADILVSGLWVIGVDAAHEGNDESVIHKRRGRLNLPQVCHRKLDGVALASAVEYECKVLEESGGKIGAIVIELDGPGVSCYDQLRRGRYANVVIGVHTGARLKDDKHYNRRAQLWNSALEYFKEGACVMDPDPEFKAQICSMLYSYKDGMLLMQDKKAYKKTFGRSPDRADAFVLTFHPFTPMSLVGDPFKQERHSAGWMG